MKGFEVIFIAPKARQHADEPVLDHIARLAAGQGLERYTRRDDTAGAAGHPYGPQFFDAGQAPEELMFVLDGGESDSLLRAVEEADIPVFCVRRQIDYWQLGETD